MDSKDDQKKNGIDGEPVEFEWKNFPEHRTLDLLHEISRKDGTKLNQSRGIFKIESASCRRTQTSLGRKVKNTPEKCVPNSTQIKAYAHRFPEGHRSWFGPGTEEK